MGSGGKWKQRAAGGSDDQGQAQENSGTLHTLSDSLHTLMNADQRISDTAAAAATSDSLPADTGSANLSASKRDTANAFIRIPPRLSYESSMVLEIALNQYFASKADELVYNVGSSGLAVGLLFPVKFPYAMVYYHVKGTFHWAVPKDTAIVMAMLTATNEIRLGVPLTFRNIPFEYSPMVGIGINNAAVAYTNRGGNIRGGGVEYYFHYTVGLAVRQPIYVASTVYSMGFSVDYEQGFTVDANTKQRLVVALIIGI